MARILLMAEHDGQTLNVSTARALNCARGLGDTDIVVFGSGASAVCEAAAKLDGAAKILHVDRAENAHPQAAIIAPQLAALAADYDYVLAPSTTTGKDVMPRTAGLLGLPQLSEIMEVIDARTFKRPTYAGNVIVTVKVPDGITVLGTVRIASYVAVGEGGSAAIENANTDAALPDHTRFVGLEASGGDRPDLQSASRVVAGGRALGSKENFELIYNLADKLGAGVGASRAAVDAGYVPNDHQVGQTGKIIAPDLYIAAGISGAIQHVTGIKDAGVIVAINKDGDAPIFEIADIGLVGDLFQIIPELEKAL